MADQDNSKSSFGLAPGPGGDNSSFLDQAARASLGVVPAGQIVRTVRRAFGGPKQPDDTAD